MKLAYPVDMLPQDDGSFFISFPDVPVSEAIAFAEFKRYAALLFKNLILDGLDAAFFRVWHCWLLYT